MPSMLCHEQPPIINCLHLQLTPNIDISRSPIERRNVMNRTTDTAMDNLSLSIFPLIRQQRRSGARLGGKFHQDAGTLTRFTPDF